LKEGSLQKQQILKGVIVIVLCYFAGIFLFTSALQCLVITEFQAKRMGVWGIPSLLGFFFKKRIESAVAWVNQDSN